MKFTIEELMLQILSTCLLINTQGKWHAFFHLSGHVGDLDVRLRPVDYDYDAVPPQAAEKKSVTFTCTDLFPKHTTPEAAQQDLIHLLSWTQGYLVTEVAA